MGFLQNAVMWSGVAAFQDYCCWKVLKVSPWSSACSLEKVMQVVIAGFNSSHLQNKAKGKVQFWRKVGFFWVWKARSKSCCCCGSVVLQGLVELWSEFWVLEKNTVVWSGSTNSSLDGNSLLVASSARLVVPIKVWACWCWVPGPSYN